MCNPLHLFRVLVQVWFLNNIYSLLMLDSHLNSNNVRLAFTFFLSFFF